MLIQRTYDWQPAYEAAILETDRSLLPKLIADARAAIDARLEVLRSDPDREAHEGIDGLDEEKQAIAEALASMQILIREFA